MPKEWADAAVDSCFSAQKKRWTTMSEPDRHQVLNAMWAFSLARQRPAVLATHAEGTLFGWLNAEPDLSRIVRILCASFASPAEIPPPPPPRSQ